MATYVLVHGGGHGGWCYQKVARLLRGRRARGLRADADRAGRAVAPARSRPSTSTPTSPTSSTCSTTRTCTDVVLVGHSYGGMVITGVADRAADRIGRLVYLDAANPVNGQSLARRRRARSSRPPARWAPSSTAWSSCCCPRPGAGHVLRRDRPGRPPLDGRTPHRPPVALLRAEARAHERGRAVGHPAVPRRLHVHVGRPAIRT